MANSALREHPIGLLRIEIERVLAQFRSGIHRSVSAGHGMEFKMVRPYDASDSPSVIDYIVSARVSEEPELQPMSRVYYTEKEISVVVVIDVGESMALLPRKIEQMHMILWLFALSAFRYHDRFRVISFADEHARDSDWIHDAGTLEDMMARDSFALDDADGTYRGNIFSYLAQLEMRDMVLVVISDFAAPWDREPEMLRRMGVFEHNITVIVFAIDEWSDARPHPYGVRLFDPKDSSVVFDDMRAGGELSIRARAAVAHLQRIEQSIIPLSGVFVRIPILSDPLRVARNVFTRMGFL